MRNVVRYSEAFKLRLVEDVSDGKYKSLDEAGRRNSIRGHATVAKWIKQYGREDILPKRIKVETEEAAAAEGCGRRADRADGFCGKGAAAASWGPETVPYAGAETGSGRHSHRP